MGDPHSNRDTGGDSRTQSPKNRLLQLRSPNLAQVSKDDSYDQRRFHPFAERNDKCLQHNVFLFLWESLSTSQKGQAPDNLREAGAALVPRSSVMRTNLVVNPGGTARRGLTGCGKSQCFAFER